MVCFLHALLRPWCPVEGFLGLARASRFVRAPAHGGGGLDGSFLAVLEAEPPMLLFNIWRLSGARRRQPPTVDNTSHLLTLMRL
jgi:hypothetical protein